MEAAILQSLRNGAYLNHAAMAAGIRPSTIRDWMAKDEALRDRVQAARDEFTNESVSIIAKHGDEDWRARAWLLERTRPEHFREQKDLQVTGELTLEQVLFEDPADSVEEIEDAEVVPAPLQLESHS